MVPPEKESSLLPAQPGQPGEGQGPDDARRQHQNEIPDGPGDHVALEDGVQRRLQALLDRQCDEKTHHDLDQLDIPDGVRGEVQLPVRVIDADHAQQRAQQGVAVLHGLGQILSVHVGREGEQLHVADEGRSQHQHPQQQLGQVLSVLPVDEGPHSDEEEQGDGTAHQHIGGGVDAQIQPGQGDQHAQGDGGQPDPEPAALGGDDAEGADGVGGVARGEGVAGGLSPGGFHDGEVRVPDPGPGDPAGDLHELVDQCAQKAHAQQVIAPALVHAPERHQCGDEKHRLAAQLRQHRYDAVQPGGPQSLQKIQEIHVLPPVWFRMNQLYQTCAKCPLGV